MQQTFNDYSNPNITLITCHAALVVCVVTSAAAGAGAIITLTDNLVRAGESANFIQSFSKIGPVPDEYSSWVLPRRIGMARAVGLALTGTTLSAIDAANHGLIWKSYADEELLPFAKEVMATLACGTTKELAATKMPMPQAVNSDFDARLDLEANAEKVCAESDDYKEGVKAFLDKHEAKFFGS